MKIRYVTLLAAIAGLMAACGNEFEHQKTELYKNLR